jgi:hypothetical protein
MHVRLHDHDAKDPGLGLVARQAASEAHGAVAVGECAGVLAIA